MPKKLVAFRFSDDVISILDKQKNKTDFLEALILNYAYRQQQKEIQPKAGYVLLAIGIITIFASLFLVFNVFTGANSPPVLLEFSDISTDDGIISGQNITTIVAMVFWYLLMLFIMIAGGKIASLGVNLIKGVAIKARQQLSQLRNQIDRHIPVLDPPHFTLNFIPIVTYLVAIWLPSQSNHAYQTA